VLEIVGAALNLPLPTPTWGAGRLWLLRLGYYKFTRPKVIAEDWVWIIDHTVQIGKDKFLVMLGLRLCDLPPAGPSVSHADVEPIELLPVKHSNGDVVYEQLEAAIQNTGVPRRSRRSRVGFGGRDSPVLPTAPADQCDLRHQA
jgi:hypothetical protein